jgi:hypothetical protein
LPDFDFLNTDPRKRGSKSGLPDFDFLNTDPRKRGSKSGLPDFDFLNTDPRKRGSGGRAKNAGPERPRSNYVSAHTRRRLKTYVAALL